MVRIHIPSIRPEHFFWTLPVCMGSKSGLLKRERKRGFRNVGCEHKVKTVNVTVKSQTKEIL